MRAVRAAIAGEQQVRFEAFTLPGKPKGAGVLVQMERTIISAGTELANYTGLEPDTRVKGAWCAYPWNPGYGGVGRVLAVGPDVTHLKPGDRVFGIFPHASHTLVDVSYQLCVPVPEGLDATVAVMARMCGVAITAYRRAKSSLGETVVVFGLGLVGNLAGQFFARAGCHVLGLDVSAQRRTLAAQTGLHDTLDPAGLSERKLLAQILKRTGRSRPPVIVDAVGDSRIVEQAVSLVADNGQVIMLGTPRAPYQTDSTAMLRRAHFHGVEITGALEWTVPLLKRQSPGVTTEGNTELIFRMLSEGALKVLPLCSHVIAPDRLDQAYQGLLHEKNTYLGVVLDWENEPARAATPAPLPSGAHGIPPAPTAERGT